MLSEISIALIDSGVTKTACWAAIGLIGFAFYQYVIKDKR